MVKKNTKRTFAVLALFVMVICVFAAFLGTRAYAQNTYSDIIDGLKDSNAPQKPPIKKTGDFGSMVALADYDNCLTESEETELLELLHESAKKAKCNVGLVITKDLEGKSDSQYAAAFSRENFGNGSDSIVLMFLNTYNVPKYSRYKDWIYASGNQYAKYTTKVTNKVFDRIYDKMGSPRGNKYAYNDSTKTYGGYNYYRACKEFAKCVKRYGVSGFAAVPTMLSDYIRSSFTKFVGGLAIAVFITLIVVKSKVRSYKKKAAISASNYMDRSATRVTRQVDQFIREYTTSHTHSSSSGGHGGGGGHSGGGGGGHHR